LAATFTFSPGSGSTVCGDFSLELKLSQLAGKQVSGLDAYINYDTAKLQAVSIDHTGGIFTSYPLETINSSTGKIVIGASASAFSPVTTEGKVVKLNFKALQTSGTTNITFDYTAGSTTDSNITEAGTATDIITDPGTFTYTLAPTGTTGCQTTTTTPPPATPPPSTPPPATPAAGAKGAPSGEAPEGGIIAPNLFVSLLSLGLIASGLALHLKKRTQTLENFEKRALRDL
jgi:hypothetical protein